MKKILFLYTELADYFVNCLNLLAQDNSYELHLVFWPVKEEAPFQFDFDPKIKLYPRKDYSDSTLFKLAENLKAELIFCSGWQDQAYIKIAKSHRSKIPVISAMDNHWQGKAKQHLAKLISPLTLHRYFSHLWVPGLPQKNYAHKLGFSDEQILSGFYVANEKQFSPLYKKRKPHRKNFLFVGRYIELKGIYDLWQAFLELKQESPNEWTLTCLGTGKEWDRRPLHPDIKHLGFIQAKEMTQHILDASVFILPSHFEPWGVVVHEMAYAGLPLICSSEIGAASHFLQEGKNGFSFPSHSIKDLKIAMKKFMCMDESEIQKMGQTSHMIAQSLTPEMWINNLKRLV